MNSTSRVSALNRSAIAPGNKMFKISNGATWTGGASLFYAPTLGSRLELRYDYIDGMKIEDFDKVSMAVASLEYVPILSPVSDNHRRRRAHRS